MDKSEVYDATLATYKDRLRTEYVELSERIIRLQRFLNTDLFSGLPSIDKSDLNEQLTAMLSYQTILERRLSR